MDEIVRESGPAIRAAIERLKGIGPTGDIEAIKAELPVLLRGHRVVVPAMKAGLVVYRSRRFKDVGSKPGKLMNLTYPPPHVLLTYGRANRPGRPMFYGAVTRATATFEQHPDPGDYLAVSRWRSTDTLVLNHVGFSQDVFLRLASSRKGDEYDWVRDERQAGDEISELVRDFLAEAFCQVVLPGEEQKHVLSAAIADGLIGDPEASPFHGVIYPSIAVRADADNVALLPAAADERLRFERVEWMRVTAAKERAFDVDRLDIADQLGPDGEILWKGRLEEWTLRRQGEHLTFEVVDGEWLARDSRGNVVPPS